MISVVICTRNRCKQLGKAIDSVLAVKKPAAGYEILVMDNNSTDNTKDMVYARINHRTTNLRYIPEEKPGLHNVRHRGAYEAEGDILCYLDDDVTVGDDWLVSVAHTFAETDATVVGGKILPIYEVKPPQWLGQFVSKGPGAEGQTLGQLSLMDLGEQIKQIDPCYVWGCNFSVRKDILLECGGFHPDSVPADMLKYRGDGEIALSKAIEAKGLKAFYNPKACVYHHIPKERMTPEYFCKRQFRQGISDSFTEIRRTGTVGQSVDDPQNIQEAELFASAFVGGDLKVSFVSAPEISKLSQRSFELGKIYHRNQARKDPSLLQWILRDNYIDDKLPAQNDKAVKADNAEKEDELTIKAQLVEFQNSPERLRGSFRDHTKDPYGNRHYYENLRNRLVNAGVAVEDKEIDISDFEKWLSDNPGLQECYQGLGDCFIEKNLEHYLAYRYLDISQDDVYIDIASAGSPWANILNVRGVKSYRLDMSYPAGVHGIDIGADAGETGLPDSCCSVLSSQCAYECFRADADIKFVKESGRILNEEGRFGIAPLYLEDSYIIKTSPYCNQKHIEIDHGAERIWRDDQWKEPFSRSYSPEVFAERIYSQIPKDMKGKVLFFRNLPELMLKYPGQRIYCFFMFYCEKMSSKTVNFQNRQILYNK